MKQGNPCEITPLDFWAAKSPSTASRAQRAADKVERAKMEMERTATVRAMTACVVASCDRATFDQLLRPLYVAD